MKWLKKYNSLNIKSYTTIRNLEKEITKKINEIEDLKSSNKDLMKKNIRLRQENRKLKIGSRNES